MFEVVNPVIIGTFQIKYDEDKPLEAAKKFWNELSKKVINDIPKSFFTLRDENGKLYHFKVTENKNGANMVDFMITPITNIDGKSADIIASTFDKMMELSKKVIEQSGGRHHHHEDKEKDEDEDDSSSSASDSVDEFIEKFKKISRTKLRPISYYYYTPAAYTTDNLYMPLFIPSYTPHYIEIGFSTAFWN